MDYNSFVISLSTFMGEQDPTNADFVAILPDIINYAEGRMYRDLDMLGNKFIDQTQTTVANSRFLNLPNQTLIIDGINIITPTSRNQLVPTSREFIDWNYSDATTASVPIYFAPVSQLVVILGPWADAAYVAEVIGTQDPPALSTNNTTTMLTQYLPETFLTCAMVYASAYQKNYGAQSDDPQNAMSWEAQYSALMRSAAVWELRKKFISESWTSLQPNPVNPPPAPG